MLALEFLAPVRLWLLLAVGALAVAYIVRQRSSGVYAARFTNVELLDSVLPHRPAWRRHLPALLLILALATFVTALARPARNEEVLVEGAAVILAIDVSISMEAEDVSPSRIESAQEAAKKFVASVPDDSLLGLVTFAATAQVEITPTRDHEAVARAIQGIELREGTGIGEAIYAGLDALDTSGVLPEDGESLGPDADKPATIIVMSDGETTSGRPNDDAAAEAAERGVPVSTIAFGTDQGEVTYLGETIPVPVNEEALAEIADVTGGRTFEAASVDELISVFDDLGGSIGVDQELRELMGWFVGIGILLTILAAAMSLLWSPRLI